MQGEGMLSCTENVQFDQVPIIKKYDCNRRCSQCTVLRLEEQRKMQGEGMLSCTENVRFDRVPILKEHGCDQERCNGAMFATDKE
jgi:hypothetical protein